MVMPAELMLQSEQKTALGFEKHLEHAQQPVSKAPGSSQPVIAVQIKTERTHTSR